MLFITREAVVISQPWGCWFSSLFSIMLIEKLMCRNEAVDFAGIALEPRSTGHLLKSLLLPAALAKLGRMSWIHTQETKVQKGKIRPKTKLG